MEVYRPRDKKQEPNISVSDIVLLKDDSKKRSFWNLCTILELIVGTNGRVKSAKIQIAGERGKGKIFRRPLKLLVPLEISCKEPVTSETEIDTPIATAQQAERPTARSRRVAATKGECIR